MKKFFFVQRAALFISWYEFEIVRFHRKAG